MLQKTLKTMCISLKLKKSIAKDKFTFALPVPLHAVVLDSINMLFHSKRM